MRSWDDRKSKTEWTHIQLIHGQGAVPRRAARFSISFQYTTFYSVLQYTGVKGQAPRRRRYLHRQCTRRWRVSDITPKTVTSRAKLSNSNRIFWIWIWKARYFASSDINGIFNSFTGIQPRVENRASPPPTINHQWQKESIQCSEWQTLLDKCRRVVDPRPSGVPCKCSTSAY